MKIILHRKYLHLLLMENNVWHHHVLEKKTYKEKNIYNSLSNQFMISNVFTIGTICILLWLEKTYKRISQSIENAVITGIFLKKKSEKNFTSLSSKSKIIRNDIQVCNQLIYLYSSSKKIIKQIVTKIS